MQITSKWIKNHQSVVDNGRNDAVIMDLPPEKGGDDNAATALEFAVMALVGCITTIFSVVSKNSHVEVHKLEAVADAERPEGAPTITRVSIMLYVEADAPEDKIRKICKITLTQCPVEALFQQANIKLDLKLVVKK